MLEHVEEELGACAAATVAGAGYATGPASKDAEEAGRNVLVNLPQTMAPHPDKPYHAGHFRYEPERNVVICPRGEALVYKHTRQHKTKG